MPPGAAIGLFDPSGGGNGLAKGMDSSNELFGMPCAAALIPTRPRIPINTNTYRIAPLSRTSRPSIRTLNLNDVALSCLPELILKAPGVGRFTDCLGACNCNADTLMATRRQASRRTQALTPIQRLLSSFRWLTTSAYPEWLRVQAL